MIYWLKIFQETCEEIRKEVKPFLGSEKAREVVGRGAGGDPTKYIDILSEEIVVRMLETQGISCILISEECGAKKIGDGGSDYVVLDSIDGTTNATRNIPFVSTSIAHAQGSSLLDVDVALVYDIVQGISFTAIKGSGAFQREQPLKPSSVDCLEKAIVAVDLSVQERLPELMNRLLPIVIKAHKIRVLGSTALELCYVASGALDVFIDFRGMTRATDLAAAYLILKESGGVIVTSNSEDLNMPLKADARSGFISAANEALCREMLTSLKEERKKDSTKTLSI